ncbi:unnamed protein product [Heterosigma akashiwo]
MEVCISQSRMLMDIVNTELGTQHFNPTQTPMTKSTGRTLSKRRPDQPKLRNPKDLMRIVGKLIYPMIYTRPDLGQAVSRLARYSADPSDEHMAAAKQVLRYLKGTVDRGLVKRPEGHIRGWWHFRTLIGLQTQMTGSQPPAWLYFLDCVS